MSTKIRLTRLGKKKTPFYRLIVTDSRVSRGGQFIEQLGTYDASVESVEKKVLFDRDKVRAWLDKGAELTRTVKELLSGSGVLESSTPQKPKKGRRKGTGNPVAEKKQRQAELKAQQEEQEKNKKAKALKKKVSEESKAKEVEAEKTEEKPVISEKIAETGEPQ